MKKPFNLNGYFREMANFQQSISLTTTARQYAYTCKKEVIIITLIKLFFVTSEKLLLMAWYHQIEGLRSLCLAEKARRNNRAQLRLELQRTFKFWLNQIKATFTNPRRVFAMHEIRTYYVAFFRQKLYCQSLFRNK